MKKILLSTLVFTLFTTVVSAQNEKSAKAIPDKKKLSTTVKTNEAQRKALKDAAIKQQNAQSDKIQKITPGN